MSMTTRQPGKALKMPAKLLPLLLLASGAATAMPAGHAHGEHAGMEMPMHMPMETPAPAAPDAAPADPRYPPPTPAEIRAAFPDTGMEMQEHMGSDRFFTLLVDRLETQDVDAHTAAFWDVKAAWGTAFDKLWLGDSGRREAGATERQTELYWTHAVSRWWSSRLGLRADGGAGPDRQWLEFGVEGQAPFDVDVEATGFLGDAGRVAGRFIASRDFSFSDRLILQPRLEFNVYGQNDAETGLGSGLADSSFGLRLRYEIRREFAPYLGYRWSAKHGRTAKIARSAGEPAHDRGWVAGVRVWF